MKSGLPSELGDEVRPKCIELMRGQSLVTSLVGAQGGLRETRLTAFLGYLIALAPESFVNAFGFQGEPVTVSLETQHVDGRSDIIVDTTKGRGVIEAKVTATDASAQATRYDAKWHVLLTHYLATRAQRKRARFRYLTWQELLPLLKRLTKAHDNKVKFVGSDLLRYLEEHGMVSHDDPLQIYAREINEPLTLTAFLKAHVYFCWYEKGGKLPRMSYFAPHFGQAIANEHPGIRVGISYVSRILRVEVVEEWPDVINAVRKVQKGRANRSLRHLAPLQRNWKWGEAKRRSMLFLGEPRLVFNPPIPKSRLQGGHGWLSKRFYSFDDLFTAWKV